ncbi:hypothetical protein SAMN02799630_04460 [Paenibacillus sp. UNCCL117]|uniref:DUF456 domain-containing protein n=1 Tax=unclassified Paenibacillus TaxID=185978 RepID=UPI00088391A6|nr:MULTISPECIES: DUF456 domain-containing protein [unclassified Paenibacillus]SDE03322.1 hypothetical protein SAMN04488602_11769 [Paenibacillus sp. cl123]SFW57389.1 hypothetical protein SAMN02799630_04460 [Paenibacillus sp. UNCCL117]
MVITAWIIIIILFVVGMAGAVYPVLPGALAIYGAYFVYGFMIGFEPFGLWFWLIQTTIVAVLMVADYLVNAIGVKRFGGNRASVVGSTIGLIVGPFVIPVVGLIAGPFLGAVIGELIVGTPFRQSLRAGLGALVGFFSGLFVKFTLQLLMIILFIVWVVRYT